MSGPVPVVVIPSVPRRSAPLAATVGQWRRAGFDPLVRVQDPGVPLGHAGQRTNAEALLRHALASRPAATHLVFCEDDVDLAPALPGLLPALCTDRVTTLFVTGLAHYPADVAAAVRAGAELPGHAVREVRAVRSWYGTQGVVLPRAAVEGVLAFPGARVGWDAHVQAWLLATGTPLWTAVPNLVQHRGVPSCTGARGGRSASCTYGWPVAGEPA